MKGKSLVVLVVVLLLAGVMTSLPQPVKSAQAGRNSGPTAAAEISALPTLFTEAYCVVAVNGTLVRGSADCVASSNAEPPGGYEVIFSDNVRDCAYIATIGIPGFIGIADAGLIDVAGRFSNVNGVFVDTRAPGGAFADRPFHLALQCY